MLNLQYKNLKCIAEYLGKDGARLVIAQYTLASIAASFEQNRKVFVSPILNMPAAIFQCEDSLFDILVTITKTNNGMLVGELNMFQALHVRAEEVEHPLTWWKMNCTQFAKVGFLAKQILRISSNQIECERNCSIVGVLTSLRRCRLRPTNLECPCDDL